MKPLVVPAILVHGGAGASLSAIDGCELAAREGAALLAAGGKAIEAAVAAVVTLENDGRFNAGIGSVLGLDGMTIEMDAAVMDSTGVLGAVACLQRVRNPVQVALAVSATPHCLLAGTGAELFARQVGNEVYLPQPSAKVRDEHRLLIKKLHKSKPVKPGVSNALFEKFWNFETTFERQCDTVGAVARDSRGDLAVAVSTGGSAPSLLGRVGDSPLIGCGFYADAGAAVACTGIGEHYIRTLLAHTVCVWINSGMPLQEALQKGVDLFDREIPTGLIAMTRTDAGAASNRSMPSAISYS